ncbi:MAG: hypothetical protein ACP5MZ_02145 [Candidatus Micrarchaeia archaeon]
MPEGSRVVISLGGSFIFANMNKVKRLKTLLERRHLNAVLVTGGGRLAREYIDFARRMGLHGDKLHNIGIKSTMLNAFIMAEYFKCRYYAGDPRNIGRVTTTLATGGYKPGWTTDVCAAYACISTGAKVLFNISKERGVFDKDPSRFKNAKILHDMPFSDLYKLTKGRRKPGMNYIFDPMAARICEKYGIDVVVTNSIDDISKYLIGQKIVGTTIRNL